MAVSIFECAARGYLFLPLFLHLRVLSDFSRSLSFTLTLSFSLCSSFFHFARPPTTAVAATTASVNPRVGRRSQISVASYSAVFLLFISEVYISFANINTSDCILSFRNLSAKFQAESWFVQE